MGVLREYARHMTVIGLVFVGIAALLHVYIFYMESIAWTSKKVRAVFGTSLASAEATKEMAFNQGFYNLFLAVVTGVGIGLSLAGYSATGMALVYAGAGSMVAAALVLGLSSPDKRKAAVTQGGLPLVGLVFVTLGLL